MRGRRIAVLIPALNEEQTIAQVVRSFRAACREARVIVFDNASTDATAATARAAGAEVRTELRRGKGNVVQSMFRSIDADIYVMVDGDGTYPAEKVRELIEPVASGTADMVIGSRLLRGSDSQFKRLNRLGNRFYATLLRRLFGVRITDLLSGYRAFSRRLVKALPLVGGGFETEAEMTIKAVHRGFSVVEIPVSLVPRPEGSNSKIRIVHDGVLILNAIVALFRDYKPLTFFGSVAMLFAAAAVTALFVHATATAAIVAVFAGLTGITGVILHTVTRHFQEIEVQLHGLLAEQHDEGAVDAAAVRGEPARPVPRDDVSLPSPIISDDAPTESVVYRAQFADR
jgi:hypothetical protein